MLEVCKDVIECLRDCYILKYALGITYPESGVPLDPGHGWFGVAHCGTW
jgi:hypothetical protein